MSGFIEGLEIGLSDSTLTSMIKVDEVNVTDHEMWKGRIGKPIHGLLSAWFNSDPYVGETLWGFSLQIEGNNEVTVALGELENGKPAYLPESLLVIFGKELAKSYQIPNVDGSSWM